MVKYNRRKEGYKHGKRNRVVYLISTERKCFIMKKLSLLLSVILLLSILGSSLAVCAEKTEQRLSCVDELLGALDASYFVESSEYLLGAEDTPVAILYHLSPNGYVVALLNNSVAEYSVENNFPRDNESDVYYAGPLQYYSKDWRRFQKCPERPHDQQC